MLRMEYVFTILFLALGPLRTIPAFHLHTRERDWPYRLRVAVLASLFAGAIIAVIVVTGVSTVRNWHVSVAALDIAIGILLLRSTFSALSILGPVAEKRSGQEPTADRTLVAAAATAFSPIAAPTIVTPTGIVTIVLFLLLAQGDPVLERQIYMVLALMLGLNLLGMMLAGVIMRFVGLTVLAVIGWVFAAMQSALAIEVILSGLRLAGFVPR